MFTTETARGFIREIRAEFSDASHNVPAFIIGHGNSVIEHSHDDGEPSGTAGRPALAVLRGSGLGDAAVVVTRFFGGTKLGKGGLVRAYGDAVRAVLDGLPLAEKTATDLVETAIPYPYFERVRLLIAELGGQTIEETFGVDVTLVTRFRSELTPAYCARVADLSAGNARTAVQRHEPETILPLAAGDA